MKQRGLKFLLAAVLLILAGLFGTQAFGALRNPLPSASGPEGALQYNSSGGVGGIENLYFDETTGKLVFRPDDPEDLVRFYDSTVNAFDAAESNLLFRLSNQSGIGQIELVGHGDVGVILRGNGSMRLGPTAEVNPSKIADWDSAYARGDHSGLYPSVATWAASNSVLQADIDARQPAATAATDAELSDVLSGGVPFSEIVFTNGWKIVCTTNGLEFLEP